MWGGRFGGGPAAIMQEINASIPVDKRLWEEDITASRAHAAMLGATGIVAADDAAQIDRGLAQIASEFAANGVTVDLSLPAQFTLDLPSINCIALIVPRPIRHKTDQFLIAFQPLLT